MYVCMYVYICTLLIMCKKPCVSQRLGLDTYFHVYVHFRVCMLYMHTHVRIYMASFEC